jgi:hypothetical protein
LKAPFFETRVLVLALWAKGIMQYSIIAYNTWI